MKKFISYIHAILSVFGLKAKKHGVKPSVTNNDQAASEQHVILRGFWAKQDLREDLVSLVGSNGVQGLYQSEDGAYYLGYVLPQGISNAKFKKLLFNEVCHRHNARFEYDRVCAFAAKCSIDELDKLR